MLASACRFELVLEVLWGLASLLLSVFSTTFEFSIESLKGFEYLLCIGNTCAFWQRMTIIHHPWGKHQELRCYLHSHSIRKLFF